MTSNTAPWRQGEALTVSALSEHVADFTGWSATLFVKKKPADSQSFIRKAGFSISADKKSLTTEITPEETADLPIGDLWLVIKMLNPASTITIESRQRVTLEPPIETSTA